LSYKLNTAFYESLGIAGWTSLHKTIQHIPQGQFIIADAKRGDIGNTSTQYAKAFFDTLGCDAITVAPYMGEDSVKPFLEFPEKWAIVLGLTSNPGAKDFEMLQTGDEKLFEKVLRKVQEWGTPDNLMFVIGATQPEEFVKIRQIVPNHFFLVPGVGFQGGSLEEISKKAMNKDCGLLVNVSRAIIFPAGH
jgi:orotidine-5'-phosphate decarboxylase